MSDRFLLDTSVLSLLAPDRHPLPVHLRDWLSANTDALYLSSISIIEIEQGIYKLERAGETKRSRLFDAWLLAILGQFGTAILPLDVAVARTAARLSDGAFAKGKHPGLADVSIAATARHHDLTVVTRNLKHFAPLDVRCVDPLAD